MPMVVKTGDPLILRSPDDILGATHCLHNCVQEKCQVQPMKQVYQDWHLVSIKGLQVEHTKEESLVLNTNQLWNASIVRSLFTVSLNGIHTQEQIVSEAVQHWTELNAAEVAAAARPQPIKRKRREHHKPSQDP
ncbi:hypothetical protein M422DRAFT_254362 [Sphaerobolus stellatus SS14]|uniref:Unplaced genomic scaffold SPHSTscaffold_54, whole genome shotgun sequence n=1 Tax=Sphaerobolus stellatus (strain SS14) TaxID=990650 RepID=A0A0C9VVD3_SPHS4|nr:hypothetical protein M422DRAFT_254362 [Sphaerobolus stellatus SS14]